MQKTILFDDTVYAKKQVLALVGKGVDRDNYIIEAATKERVLSPAGKEVRLSEFAGIRNGSVIVITKDLPAVIEQADYIES